MNIAFIHYHLKPGGVTRVIEQQSEICTKKGWNYCILAGENPMGLPNVIVLPELHYDIHRSSSSAGETGAASLLVGENKAASLLADEIISKIRAFFSAEPQILHIHNATLAKNSNLLPALRLLQEKGLRLFLQLHDFAEDGRPGIYSDAPYPANVHYGYINSRDGEYLLRSGIPRHFLHAIPNLVSRPPGNPNSFRQTSGRRIMALYPVRGIRRKNLGEIVLLATLLDNLEIGITLPPNNPADRPSHDFWKSTAATICAPVKFEIAAEIGFEAAIERADFFISTSVQEGFGFAFLEPWTIGKSVAGRKIPYVHKDFESAGMDMPWFYDGIPIPRDIIDMDDFRAKWLKEARKRLGRFRIALQNQGLNAGAEKTRVLESGLPQIFRREFELHKSMDFARLDRENQARVVHRCAESNAVKRALLEASPILHSAPFNGRIEECRDIAAANNRQVAAAYGEEKYSSRISRIYAAVASQDPQVPPRKYMDKEKLLFLYLDPARMFLISAD